MKQCDSCSFHETKRDWSRFCVFPGGFFKNTGYAGMDRTHNQQVGVQSTEDKRAATPEFGKLMERR